MQRVGHRGYNMKHKNLVEKIWDVIRLNCTFGKEGLCSSEKNKTKACRQDDCPYKVKESEINYESFGTSLSCEDYCYDFDKLVIEDRRGF